MCIDEWLKYLTKSNQLIPIGQAKRGDLVFFQFDADAQPDHVGIVQYHNTTLKYVNVWEGNTSDNKTGSQSNGDGFYLKRRKYDTIMAIALADEIAALCPAGHIALAKRAALDYLRSLDGDTAHG